MKKLAGIAFSLLFCLSFFGCSAKKTGIAIEDHTVTDYDHGYRIEMPQAWQMLTQEELDNLWDQAAAAADLTGDEANAAKILAGAVDEASNSSLFVAKPAHTEGMNARDFANTMYEEQKMAQEMYASAAIENVLTPPETFMLGGREGVRLGSVVTLSGQVYTQWTYLVDIGDEVVFFASTSLDEPSEALIEEALASITYV